MCIGFLSLEEGLYDKLRIVKENNYLWKLFSLMIISLNWQHIDLVIFFFSANIPKIKWPPNKCFTVSGEVTIFMFAILLYGVNSYQKRICYHLASNSKGYVVQRRRKRGSINMCSLLKTGGKKNRSIPMYLEKFIRRYSNFPSKSLKISSVY